MFESCIGSYNGLTKSKFKLIVAVIVLSSCNDAITSKFNGSYVLLNTSVFKERFPS